MEMSTLLVAVEAWRTHGDLSPFGYWRVNVRLLHATELAAEECLSLMHL